MATLTVGDLTPRLQYTAAAGQTAFTYNFPIFQDSDLKVYVGSTLQTLTTNYTVSGAGTSSGGTVTFTSGRSAGDIVTIYRDMPVQRTTDYQANGDLLAENLNDDLDKLTMMVQQNEYNLGLTLRADQFDETTNLTIPNKATRANSYLKFDTNGAPVTVTDDQLVAGLAGAVIGANYITNNATGDGTTVNFTLSSAPGSKGNLQIYIDGVYQNKATFSLAGTTVTFTEAPPLNASVEFIIGYSIGSYGDAGDVSFTQQGSGASTRTVESKLNEFVSVKDFGAVGDGVTDDTTAILAAFAAIKAANGGVLEFPQATYLISHGFRVPSNTVINLNGSTLKATTTYAQGSIPTEGDSSFFALGRPQSESPLSSDIGNIVINGGGAVLDGRRDEQTGTIGGYSGIKMETTDTPVEADFLKLKNIVIKDLTIDRIGYDGIYVAGVKNLVVENVIVNAALRIGVVGIAGDNVTFRNVTSQYTVGDNSSLPAGQQGPSNSGDGFWNEPNNTWQSMTNWAYENCKALYNYQSGFKIWNAGADAVYHMRLDNCYSYSNVYDSVTDTLRSSPGEAGFIITTNGTSAAEASVTFNGCIAESENGSGFVINPNGDGSLQRFVLNNCVAYKCNQNNSDSINRAPFRVKDSAYTSTPTIVNNDSVVIAPSANTLGYGMYFGSMKNVFLNNPKFIGTFTQELTVSSTYTPNDDERDTAFFQTGATKANVDDSVFKFAMPVRPALFDQTSEPTIADHLFRNEIAIWQDDNNQFTGVYRRPDSTTPKYIDFQAKKRLRGAVNLSSSASISAQDVETGTITVTGAALGDIVTIAATVNLDSDLILTARVSAADTVSYYVHNPSSGSVTRAATYLVVNVFGNDF